MFFPHKRFCKHTNTASNAHKLCHTYTHTLRHMHADVASNAFTTTDSASLLFLPHTQASVCAHTTHTHTHTHKTHPHMHAYTQTHTHTLTISLFLPPTNTSTSMNTQVHTHTQCVWYLSCLTVPVVLYFSWGPAEETAGCSSGLSQAEMLRSEQMAASLS